MVALLLANAVFVAAEFALVTVRRTRLEMLADDGSASATRVLGAVGNLDYFVAASQLGITMASIALGFVGEPVLAGLIEPPVEAIVGSFAPAVSHTLAIAVAFLFVTSLHIVVGEFVPKTIALQEPERTSMAISRFMNVFVKVFGPAIWLLNSTGNFLLRVIGMTLRPISEAPLEAEDIAMSLESSATAGLISRRELSLARHTLELRSTEAEDIMVPRNDIVAISLSSSREEVLQVMAENRHSRYPVFDISLDDITGVIDTKLVFLDIEPDLDWRRHIQNVTILPESAPVQNVLEVSRDADTELVILVDEYGGTAGMLSLFDIAERLAGSLPEDLDTEASIVNKLPDGSASIAGRTRIEEVNDVLGISLPHEEAQTIGGLVLEIFGRIPETGESRTLDAFEFKVVAMDGHRVDQVLLTPPRRPVPDEEASAKDD